MRREMKAMGRRARSLAVAGALALSLSACGQGDQGATSSPVVAQAIEAAADAAVGGEAARGKVAAVDASAPPADAPREPAAGGQMLAYAHSATLAAPADELAGLMRRHEAACVAAGPTICQVVGASAQGVDDDRSAALSLRAEPRWLADFRAKLEGDAKAADGRLIAQSVESEDLTRSITDAAARLRALVALRTRLEALIASRPGKLADLLEVERELARVQAEIDGLESGLAQMRTRVAMSRMDVSYVTRASAVNAGAFSPLADAWNGALGTMARSLAFLIHLAAVLLPFALLLAPLGWLVLRGRARRRAGRAAAAPPVDQSAP
jgi:hypothetical protein